MSTEKIDEAIATHRESLRYHLSAEKKAAFFSKLPSATSQRSKYVYGLAAMALVAAGFLIGLTLKSPGAEELIPGEIVSAHVRSLMPGHISDVLSTDQHTVKPWFEGKLDFAPQVKDYAAAGFSLSGGRLDYVGSRPVAAIIYMRRKHAINFFQWPVSATNTRPRLLARRGFQIYTWVGAGIENWLISDLNAAELQQFTDLILADQPK